MNRRFIKSVLPDILGPAAVSIVLGLIVTLTSGGFFGKKKESLSYNQQIESLNNIEVNLKELIQFVELRKGELKKTEDILSQLKEEERKLKPVIEADRKLMEAIFALQAQQNKKDIWKERGIGFILGVLSSMVASIALGLFRRSRTQNGGESAVD